MDAEEALLLILAAVSDLAPWKEIAQQQAQLWAALQTPLQPKLLGPGL